MARTKKVKIYIACRGGVVQGVRCSVDAECVVIDYDDHECDRGRDGMPEEDFEREHLDGRTWDEMAKETEPVW